MILVSTSRSEQTFATLTLESKIGSNKPTLWHEEMLRLPGRARAAGCTAVFGVVQGMRLHFRLSAATDVLGMDNFVWLGRRLCPREAVTGLGWSPNGRPGGCVRVRSGQARWGGRRAGNPRWSPPRKKTRAVVSIRWLQFGWFPFGAGMLQAAHVGRGFRSGGLLLGHRTCLFLRPGGPGRMRQRHQK